MENDNFYLSILNMLNVLIIEDNLKYVKYFLNTILNNFDEISIKYIATSVKEAEEILSNNIIDLIFLDLNLQGINGIQIIQKIKSFNSLKKPYIIIISGEIDLINSLIKQPNVYNIINKLQSKTEIYNLIKKFIFEFKFNENETNIKNFIRNSLKNKGYNFKYKGTIYLLESIEYIYRNNNMDLLSNLEKNVYSYISHKYKKTVRNIKTNIVKATNYINYNNYYCYKETPKEVISNILINLDTLF